MKDKMIAMLGKDWCDVLSEYIYTEPFLDIARFITKERAKGTVYPGSDKVFRAFRETGYYQTKVVMLGQDPYFDGKTVANGLAFCCGDSLSNSPSMVYILREIDNEYPENKHDIDYERIDRGNFQRLAKQGVLLLNKALTVAKNKPKSHLKQWDPFINMVIMALDKKPGGVVFLLLGKEAQKIKPLIKHCPVVEAAHPAVHAYGGEGFLGSNVFRRTNEQLTALNKSEIIW